jgi:hypothetical protein
VVGLLVSLGLYIGLDSKYGSLIGPGGMNQDFMSMVSLWQQMGGMAQAVEEEGCSGDCERGEPVAIAHRIDLTSAPGQTKSDLLWIGIPALIGAGIEILVRAIRVLRTEPSPAAE